MEKATELVEKATELVERAMKPEGSHLRYLSGLASVSQIRL